MNSIEFAASQRSPQKSCVKESVPALSISVLPGLIVELICLSVLCVCVCLLIVSSNCLGSQMTGLEMP